MFKADRLAGECLLKHFLKILRRALAIVPAGGIEAFRPGFQQFLARATKELFCLGIGLDEANQIHVVHGNGIGCLLHQYPEPGFALAQRPGHVVRQAQGAGTGGGQRPGDAEHQHAGEQPQCQYLCRARRVTVRFKLRPTGVG